MDVWRDCRRYQQCQPAKDRQQRDVYEGTGRDAPERSAGQGWRVDEGDIFLIPWTATRHRFPAGGRPSTFAAMPRILSILETESREDTSVIRRPQPRRRLGFSIGADASGVHVRRSDSAQNHVDALAQ